MENRNDNVIGLQSTITDMVGPIADTFSRAIIDVLNDEAKKLTKSQLIVAGTAKQIALTHQLGLYLADLAIIRGEPLEDLLEDSYSNLKEISIDLEKRLRSRDDG